MATLEALPNELLARIISFSDRKSLAQLRLTSKRLDRTAIEKLFERITLYAHWAKDVGTKYYQCRWDFEDDSTASSRGEDVPGNGNALANLNDKMSDDEVKNFIPASELREDDLSLIDENNCIDLFAPNSEEDEAKYRKRECAQRDGAASRPSWALKGYLGPPDYDANVFKDILENASLRKYVKDVQIYTCETHHYHNPELESRKFQDSRPQPCFDPVYDKCIERLGELPNLRGVALHFDRHVGVSHGEDDVCQRGDFQPKFFERTFQPPLAKTISHLAIQNFENRLNANEVPYFFEQAARVTFLRLSVKHKGMRCLTYRYVNNHSFWEIFPTSFLKPASDLLTTLVLYSDIPVGWFPKLDLRKMHLPKLTSLTLGHHIFHDEHQVNWIISHRDTLRELNLDLCSILYQIGYNIPGWLDVDGYPRAQPRAPLSHNIYDYPRSSPFTPIWDHDPVEFEACLLIRSYPLRWHSVFSRFASELHRLETFRFGYSAQWDFDTSTRQYLPVMPWEDEHNIKSGLFEERYVIWDDFCNEYRSKWITAEKYREEHFQFNYWQDEWLAKLESYPDCADEDEAALRALVKIV